MGGTGLGGGQGLNSNLLIFLNSPGNSSYSYSNHYIDTSMIGINTQKDANMTTSSPYNFYVNGSTGINGPLKETALWVNGKTLLEDLIILKNGLVGTSGFLYGADSPSTIISNPVEGQIYFQIVE